MLRRNFRSFLLFGIVLLTSASSITSRQRDEESLKSALDAVTRKQRSLDFSPRDYYNDLGNFKYHTNDDEIEDKFSKKQNLDLEDNDDELEFLPFENGQLENIGGGYQNFNNKRLERALMDYFENSGQKDTVSSAFRERERGGGHKRALTNNHLRSGNDPDKDLAAILYKELEKGSLYGNDKMSDIDNQDYLRSEALQSYYEKYLDDEANLDKGRAYESNTDPMSWGDIFTKHESFRNNNGKNMMENESEEEDDDSSLINGDFGHRDHESMFVLPTERRNVNGRYPLGREYGVLLKRFSLTKRSPKPLNRAKEPTGVINDPKIAKDLGPLFGDEKTIEAKHNRTEVKISSSDKNDRRHEHDHVGNHDNNGDSSTHDHRDPSHNHDHSSHDDRDHPRRIDDKPTDSSRREIIQATTSEVPKSLINSPKATSGQKEITTSSNGGGDKRDGKSIKLINKRDHGNMELTKKNVDWSQYFGIDRRKKKAALLAKPGSQDEDDEWMLQSYYKTMAENLKSLDNDEDDDKENGEKKHKLDQLDAKLKNFQNLFVQNALKYKNEENSEDQRVKETVMARLAIAYSLAKIRQALKEFRSNIAAYRGVMKTPYAKNKINHSHDEADDGKNGNENEKRSGHEMAENAINSYEGRNYEGFDEGRNCPVLDAMINRCPHAGGNLKGVQELCIMNQICHACDDEEVDCSSVFDYGVDRICDDIPDDRRRCERLISYWKKQALPTAKASCNAGPESCLRRSNRYHHRRVYYQTGWLPNESLDASQLAER